MRFIGGVSLGIPIQVDDGISHTVSWVTDGGNVSLTLDSFPTLMAAGGVVSPFPTADDSIVVGIGGVADLTLLTSEGIGTSTIMSLICCVPLSQNQCPGII